MSTTTKIGVQSEAQAAGERLGGLPPALLARGEVVVNGNAEGLLQLLYGTALEVDVIEDLVLQLES